MSQQTVSLAELGVLGLSLALRCRMVATCGAELGWRLYPTATVRLRDSGQLAIAQGIVEAAHPAWHSRIEVPVAPGDLRAADLVLTSIEEVIDLEIERVLVDAQAQVRSAQIKRAALAERDARAVRLVIAVPDTRSTRTQLASLRGLLSSAFPVPSRRIWASIRSGVPVGGDGLLLVPRSRLP